MYSTGAQKSPYDIRTYSYKPDKANYKGGQRYTPKYINDQHRVGICTSISLTMNVHRATGKKYSPDFQYLLQKKFIDGNWDEGSSAFSALKAAHKYGMLPVKEFEKYVDEDDRKLTYRRYIKKLQNISDKDVDKLLAKCEKPIEGYAKVPASRDLLANGIDENESGLIARFTIGKEWWTKPIEPLRKPKEIISGHLINLTNYAGNSFRIANSWGTDWADKGTAYHLHRDYRPTEAWAVFYKEIPEEVDTKPIAKKVIDIAELLKLIKILKALGIIN